MLIRLIYVSTAHQPVTDQMLNSILVVAAARNIKYGVTGFLNYNGSEFMQIIEGEDSKIDQLAANLQKDQRHYNFTTVKRETIEQRAFPYWSMQMLKVKHAQLPEQTRATRNAPTLEQAASALPSDLAQTMIRYNQNGLNSRSA